MRVGLSPRFIPNIISSSRIGLAAVFVAVETPNVRLALVGLAAATDFLDGWIARRANWTSRAGALVDAFADRVFVLVAVSTFLFTGALTTLGYFVMIARDLATAVGFLVARMMASLRTATFKARFPGKLVTVLQLATLFALIKQPALVAPLLWLVAAASAYAIADYIIALSRARAA